MEGGCARGAHMQVVLQDNLLAPWFVGLMYVLTRTMLVLHTRFDVLHARLHPTDVSIYEWLHSLESGRAIYRNWSLCRKWRSKETGNLASQHEQTRMPKTKYLLGSYPKLLLYQDRLHL